MHGKVESFGIYLQGTAVSLIPPLVCPSYRWLPNRRGGVSGFGVPPASMRRAAEDQQGGGRHNWGQGFRLGDQ